MSKQHQGEEYLEKVLAEQKFWFPNAGSDQRNQYPELEKVLDRPSATDSLRTTNRWRILGNREENVPSTTFMAVALLAILLGAMTLKFLYDILFR